MNPEINKINENEPTMKLLAQIDDKDILESPIPESQNLKIRHAARAILFNKDNNIALIKVTKRHHHKLPGGGLEDNEDISEALTRELAEETGCTATVTKEVGKIEETRNQANLKQISYCYIAEISGEQQELGLTQDEIDKGSELIWVPLEKAIELLKNDDTADYHGKFIKVRDSKFLEEAKQILTEK